LEYLLIHRKEKDFYKKFKKVFPELEIDDDNVLTGIYEGRYQILIMDRIFEKRVNQLEEFISEESKHMYFNVFEKSKDGNIDKGVMSLGQFLSMAQKYQPIIKTRFKGIGELEAKDLRDNALDPRNRILIRLTIEDIERDLEKFNILHGDDSNERRLLMEHFKIARDDLDN
jgi:DNA gyrase/topoisomerase IV subunit B